VFYAMIDRRPAILRCMDADDVARGVELATTSNRTSCHQGDIAVRVDLWLHSMKWSLVPAGCPWPAKGLCGARNRTDPVLLNAPPPLLESAFLVGAHVVAVDAVTYWCVAAGASVVAATWCLPRLLADR
jgi:hypothetical protein